MADMTEKELAAYFDHTLLKAEAVTEGIEKLCTEAVEFGFASVCVNPRWVRYCADKLEKTSVKVCTVAGFPLGAVKTASKAEQTKAAVMDGADEIDMVADLASVIEGDRKYYLEDIAAVLRECQNIRPNTSLKVIIESAALNEEQITFAAGLAGNAGADFVKTSTGFHPAGGAAVEDIRLIKTSAPRCKVKASGGIRSLETALAMIEAGADRIGASASVNIVKELRQNGRDG